jgi:hypothetical protein
VYNALWKALGALFFEGKTLLCSRGRGDALCFLEKETGKM